MELRYLLLSCVLFAKNSIQEASPLEIQWSDTTYGPDGPWYAVTVNIGSDNQAVDLYPADRYESTILSSSLCDNTTLSSYCYANRAGTYNPATSNSSVNVTSSDEWEVYFWNKNGGRQSRSNIDSVTLVGATNEPSVSNVSLVVVDNAYQTYTAGHSYPVNVGRLSLGAPVYSATVNGDTENYISGYLYNEGLIPSYSYGMHIGSAATPKIAPSLWLGGYDENRVYGDVSAQGWQTGSAEGALVIQLSDVGIGVATGASPFSFTNKTGLFSVNGTGVSQQPVTQVSPVLPYIYLPQATCDGIVAELPVIFNDTLGLYLWNTSDSRYETIIKSPAYLSFSFYKNGNNNEDFTIKLPFALLNLTLYHPLTEAETPYFPIAPRDADPMFGRAFLQAAFIGVNWGSSAASGAWFMAQAPGPGYVVTPSVMRIENSDTTINASASSWEKSWEAYWTPLDDSSSGSSSSSSSSSSSGDSSSSSSGLSTGAKAGIGVGVGIAGVVLIAAAVAVLMRRKRAARSAEAVQAQAVPMNAHQGYLPVENYPAELANHAPAAEKMVDTSSQPHEMHA